MRSFAVKTLFIVVPTLIILAFISLFYSASSWIVFGQVQFTTLGFGWVSQLTAQHDIFNIAYEYVLANPPVGHLHVMVLTACMTIVFLLFRDQMMKK